MVVVGGVYRERCRLPYSSDETCGSSGRAAAVIAGLSLKTTLHSAVDKQTEQLLEKEARCVVRGADSDLGILVVYIVPSIYSFGTHA